MKAPCLSRAWGFDFWMPQRRSGDGEAKSAIDTALDRIDFRGGHGGERWGRDRFRSGHRRSTKHRLNDFGLRNNLNRFGMNRLVLTDLVISGPGLTGFVAGRRGGREERFQRPHCALDLFLSKLKAIKLADNPVEFGMRDFKSRQVV